MLVASELTGRTQGWVAQVVLSSGAVAGEGGGPTRASAEFWAVYGAMRSADARFALAGRGHRVFLSAADQSRLAGEVA